MRYYETMLWCPWPESNQHSLRNSILSRARLPVPPQGPAPSGRRGDIERRRARGQRWRRRLERLEFRKSSSSRAMPARWTSRPPAAKRAAARAFSSDRHVQEPLSQDHRALRERQRALRARRDRFRREFVLSHSPRRHPGADVARQAAARLALCADRHDRLGRWAASSATASARCCSTRSASG